MNYGFISCQLLFDCSVAHRPTSGLLFYTPHAMTKTPDPREYSSFADWLAVVTAGRGVQREIARACGVSPQAITKWLQGGQVKPEPLRKLADWAGRPYSDLRMLADGLSQPAPAMESAIPTTDDLLERWRSLPPAARVYVISLMDAISRIPIDSLPTIPPKK